MKLSFGTARRLLPDILRTSGVAYNPKLNSAIDLIPGGNSSGVLIVAMKKNAPDSDKIDLEQTEYKAIKFRNELVGDECQIKTEIASFEREISVLTGTNISSFIEIENFGTTDKLPWFTMPLKDCNLEHKIINDYNSSSLQYVISWLDDTSKEMGIEKTSAQNRAEKRLNLLRSKPLDLERILNIAEEIGCSLASLHLAKKIHRDVKPSNILIGIDDQGNEKYYLADFEEAKEVINGITTNTGGAGSNNWKSPEAELLGQVGWTSDVYSLGMVLYQMIKRIGGPFILSLNNSILEKVSALDPTKSRIFYLRAEQEAHYRYLGLSDPIDKETKTDFPEQANRPLVTLLKKSLRYKDGLEKPWQERYQTMEEFLFDLKLVKKQNAFNAIYDFIKHIDFGKTKKEELEDCIKGIIKKRDSILEYAIEDIKKEFSAKIEKFDALSSDLTEKEKQEEKKRVFGKVLDLVNGTAKSEIITELESAIQTKFDSAYSEISEYANRHKDETDVSAKSPEEILTEGEIIGKYNAFLTTVALSSLPKAKTFDNLVSAITALSKIYLPDSVVPLFVLNANDSEETLAAKKNEYTRKYEAAKSDHEKTLEKYKENDEARVKVLQTVWSNYESKVSEQTGKIDQVLTDLKSRCEAAEKSYYTNAAKINDALATLCQDYNGVNIGKFKCINETGQNLAASEEIEQKFVKAGLIKEGQTRKAGN
jgi:serine/threonine protein kinase